MNQRSIQQLVDNMAIQAQKLKECAGEMKKAAITLRETAVVWKDEKDAKGINTANHLNPGNYILLDK